MEFLFEGIVAARYGAVLRRAWLADVGAGTVPWPDILKALRAVEYDGLFNFEVPGESQNCPLPARLAKLDYAKTLARCMIDEIYAMV